MHKLFIVIAILFSVHITAQSTITFTYDSVGNQVERKYCPTGNCNSGAKQINENPIQAIDITEKETITDFINRLRIYPNPTKGNLRIEWDKADADTIKSIQVSDAKGSSSFVVHVQNDENFALVDLTNYASGTYFVEFTLNDSKRVIKQIIKN